MRENAHSPEPKPPLLVVYHASAEVRNSIVFSTILVVLVFVPLFALSGMEGRLFTPLGIAYIVSILASLLVSLTVTPVLSYWLLPSAKITHRDRDSFLLRWLKVLLGIAVRFSIRRPGWVLGTVGVAVLLSCIVVTQLGRDFLPPFNEGERADRTWSCRRAIRWTQSNKIAGMVEDRLRNIEGVAAFGRRTGRAELDEHAEGVNMSEIIVSFDPNCRPQPRGDPGRHARGSLPKCPGRRSPSSSRLQHVISQVLSGVKAQIGIKLYGDDLNVLRAKANEMKAAIQGVRGVKDLMVEQQVEIPQLRDHARSQGDGHLRAELGRRGRVGRDGDQRPRGLGNRARAAAPSI